MYNDTIVAPATAMTNSGIGIIRISGDSAINLTSNLFPDLMKMKSHTIRYGFLFDGGDIIDEVMVSLMKAPSSYTREDVVEINCHGGVRVINRILDCLVKNGARLAEPGEFTKRAFLNGRIDLSKAEAVMDIISAKNDFALKSSVKQLRGEIFEAVKSLREEILFQIAFIEAALDDPEHYDLDGYDKVLGVKIETIISELSRLLKSADQGKVLKEGINTVIIGKPNVGKSSLLNLLVGEERAIVTDIAGTTRDIISESVIMDGFMLNIIDTAGIRQTDDKIEKIGVEKTLQYLEDADLVIFILDAVTGIEEEDQQIIKLLNSPPRRGARRAGWSNAKFVNDAKSPLPEEIPHNDTVVKKIITLLNKVDIAQNINNPTLVEIVNTIYPHVENFVDKSRRDVPPNPASLARSSTPLSNIIHTSFKTNTGIDKLKSVIREMFINNEIDNENEIYITNQRHKESLHKALESLLQVKKSINEKMTEDFLTIDMMNAYTELGKIIGEQVDDDLVNEIFGKFCVGK